MKKILIMVLAIVFCFGVAAQASTAKTDEIAKGKKMAAQEMREKGADARGHWAEPAMMEANAKGIMKGYPDGTFKPRNAVSNLEAIVMIVRAADLEDDAMDAHDAIADGVEEIPADLKHTAQVPVWADGYIWVAYEEGILIDGELDAFRPNQAAKRMDVALWISRSEIFDDEDDYLDVLNYVDSKDIPEDYRHAIALLARHEVMNGDNNHRFNPNKPVTRAEMATIFKNFDDVITNISFKVVHGTIAADVDAGDDSISIYKNNADDDINFDIDTDCDVYLDNKEAALQDLEKDMTVKLVLNKDGDVIFIGAKSVDEDEDENETEFEGRIIRLYTDDDEDEFLTIKSGSKYYSFEVVAVTNIETTTDENADYDDLKRGDYVEIVATDFVAESIVVVGNEDYTGTIDSLGVNSFKLVGVDGTFNVNDDTEYDGVEEFADLQLGDKVEFEADGHLVLEIEVVD